MADALHGLIEKLPLQMNMYIKPWTIYKLCIKMLYIITSNPKTQRRLIINKIQ